MSLNIYLDPTLAQLKARLRDYEHNAKHGKSRLLRESYKRQAARVAAALADLQSYTGPNPDDLEAAARALRALRKIEQIGGDSA